MALSAVLNTQKRLRRQKALGTVLALVGGQTPSSSVEKN